MINSIYVYLTTVFLKTRFHLGQRMSYGIPKQAIKLVLGSIIFQSTFIPFNLLNPFENLTLGLTVTILQMRK